MTMFCWTSCITKKAFDHIRAGDIALSIGGDNYCYADVKRYTMMHDMLLQRGAKTGAVGMRR